MPAGRPAGGLSRRRSENGRHHPGGNFIRIDDVATGVDGRPKRRHMPLPNFRGSFDRSARGLRGLGFGRKPDHAAGRCAQGSGSGCASALGRSCKGRSTGVGGRSGGTGKVTAVNECHLVSSGSRLAVIFSICLTVLGFTTARPVPAKRPGCNFHNTLKLIIFLSIPLKPRIRRVHCWEFFFFFLGPELPEAFWAKTPG